MSSPQNNDQPAGSYDPADRYNNPGYYPPVSTYTPEVYNPLDRYNSQNQGTGVIAATNSMTTATTAGVQTSPFLPNQVLGNPNIWRIAAVLDGGTDQTYTHEITGAELSAAFIAMQFAHGLSFTPTVDGSFLNTTSKKRYAIPHFQINAPSYGANNLLSSIMTIDSVDDKYIYIQIAINDAFGLSFYDSNYQLTFKFYCFQDGTVSQ